MAWQIMLSNSSKCIQPTPRNHGTNKQNKSIAEFLAAKRNIVVFGLISSQLGSQNESRQLKVPFPHYKFRKELALVIQYIPIILAAQRKFLDFYASKFVKVFLRMTVAFLQIHIFNPLGVRKSEFHAGGNMRFPKFQPA